MRQDQNYMAIVSATGSTRLTMHLHRVDVLQQGCIFSLILQLLRSIYSMYQVALNTLKEMLIYCDNTYNLEATSDMPCYIQTNCFSTQGMIDLESQITMGCV